MNIALVHYIELALRVLAVLRGHFPQARLIITGPPGPHNPANAAYFARLKQLRAELGLAAAAHFLTLSSPTLPSKPMGEVKRSTSAVSQPAV